MNKEFWVRTKDHEHKDVTRDMDRLCLDYEPDQEAQEVFTRVIEYSAYEELLRDNKTLKEKLNDQK